MNREIIDKCLDFAEGKKGTFTILTVKKPDLPENLISGTEKQQTINGYVKISIHAPREGGDRMNDIMLTMQNISIHAPREGGDR